MTDVTSLGGSAANHPGLVVKLELPPLPYDCTALEPHIDARTMMLHHDKHHAGYVEKLNKALEKFPDLQEQTALWLLVNTDKVPNEIRTAVHNNAGGHVNHSLFWQAMSPDGGGEPSGSLAEAIDKDFGSFDSFKTQFDKAGGEVFGSGWVWLAQAEKNGKLEVLTTTGHDHPQSQGYFPVLLNDVWEHAYYLHHENRRPDYLKGWWSVVNWRAAETRFAEAPWKSRAA